MDLDAHTSGHARGRAARSIGTTQDAAAHTATIEVELTAPEILAAPRSRARGCRIGLYRMEGNEPARYLAWSPPRTAKPNFHVPEAFGTLVLDAAP